MKKSNVAAVGSILIGLALAGLPAAAQTSHAWNGLGTNNNWSSVTNWVSLFAPTNVSPTSTTNYVALAGTTRLTPNVDAPWTIFGLIISNGAGGFTLGGSDLTVTAASPGGATNVFIHNGASNVVINNNIILPATLAPTNRRTMQIASSGSATFNGVITNNGAGLGDLFVRGGGTGVGTLAGPIWLGTNKLFHTDIATWVIASTNNVWSITELDTTSTLRIAVSDALPTNSLVQFDNTAAPRLDMNNFNQTVLGMTGTGVVRTGTGVGGTLTVSDLGATNVFRGLIVENGALIKNGSGMFTLQPPSPNYYTNGTTVNGGVLRLSYSQTTLNLGTIRGPLTINGATVQATVEKAFGFANSSSGNVTVVTMNGGFIDFTGANGLGGGQTYLVRGGAIQSNGGTNSATASGYIRFASSGPDPTFYTLATNVTSTISGRVQLDAAAVFNTEQGSVISGPDLQVNAAITGSKDLTKTGAGTLLLQANNTYSGNTAIMAGTLALGASGSLSNSPLVTISSNAIFDVAAHGTYTPPPLEVIQGSGIVTGSVVTPDGSQIYPGGAGSPGTLTFANDLLLSLSAGYTNYFDLTNSLAIGGGTNDLLVVNGDFEPGGNPVSINALAPLVSGTYRLINYGTNYYGMTFGPVIGNTSRDTWTLDTSISTQVNLVVSAGTNQFLVWSPQASADWDIQTAQNWTNNAAGTLDVYADEDTVLFNDIGAVSNVVNLTTILKPAAVTVNSSSNYAITGAGRLSNGYGQQSPITKDGSGTLTIATTNDFTGGIVVSNGTVAFASSTAMGVGPIMVASVATLRDDAGNTLPGVVSGSGRIIKTGSGTTTLSGANTYDGPMSISNGAFVVSGPGYLGGGLFASGISNNGALTFNNATQTLSGTISGAGSLTQGGVVNGGVLTLTGANTFTGLTTASAGVLALASTNGPAIVGPVVFDNNLSPDLYATVDNQFGPGVVMTYTNNAGDHGRFELLGTTQTLAGIQTAYVAQKGIIQNREAGPYNLTSTGALLVLNGSGSYFFSGYLRDSPITGSNMLSVVKLGTGTQTLWGTVIDYSGPTIVGAGSLILTNVDDSWSTGLTISNGASLVVDTSARQYQWKGKATFSGAGKIIKLGSSTNGFLLGNSGTGVTMAMAPGGLIDVQTVLMRNEFGQYNNWTNNKASLSVSNGASFWIWDANTFVDALNGEGTIEKGQNNNHTLTVGTADGSGTFNGPIKNTLGVLNFTKTGLGTQTLGGNNSYSGITTVAAGTLALSASGGITGTPRIIVATNATFDVTAIGNLTLAGFQSLEGGGLVTGSVSTATGSKIIPGSTGAAGTLTFGNNLGLNAATTNYFELSDSDTTIGNGINDLVNVGGLLEPSSAVVAVSFPSSTNANGTYRLFNYSGAKTTTFNPAVAGNTTRKAWTINEATSGQVNLVVSGSFGVLTWSSQTSTNWDLNVGTNWLIAAGGTNSTYLDGDNVLFDDSGAVTNTIGIVGTLKPSLITVNSSSNYTITGGGKISGTANLTKDGTGLLILGGANNDFNGGVVVSNGTLRAGGNGIVPLNNVAMISSNGTLNFDSGNATYTYSNVVSGSGTLLLTFTGATANNVYLPGASTGFTGTIQLTPIGAVGSKLNTSNLNIDASAHIKIDSGAQMLAMANSMLANPIQIVGPGNNENRGAIRLVNATLSGPISLAGSATIGTEGGTNSGPIATSVSGAQSLTLGTGASTGTGLFLGNISDGVGTLSLIVSNGTSTLLGTNTYTGGTTLNGGTLVVAELADADPSGIGTNGLISFGGGTLRYIGAVQTATMRNITNVNLSRTIIDVTNAAASVLLGGTIGGTGGLTKLGAGMLVISNSSVTWLQANPGLTVRGGTLLVANGQINSQNPANYADYIGQSGGDVATMTLAGSSTYNRSNSILYIADQPNSKGTFNIQDNASFWGNYQVRLGQNAGATGTIYQASGSFTVNSSDLAIGNSGVGTYYHQGGSITNIGTMYVGVNSGSLGTFYQYGGSVYQAGVVAIGNNAGANGAFYHTNGSVVANGEFDVGYGQAGAYGFYQLIGGSLINNTWQQVARTGIGLMYLNGGTDSQTNPANGIVVGNVGTGVLYVAGGQVNVAGKLGIGWTGTSRGEATIAGGSTVTLGTTGVQFNQAAGTTFNVLNLNGGLLQAQTMFKQNIGGYSVVNFNGGTFRGNTSQTILGAGAGAAGALDNAFVYGGGAIIDSSNLVITVAQPLRAPTGNGVTALPATGTLPGYIGAPYVSISGGGGTGATAIALFDYTSGSVTGLVITSPGTDYTSQPNVTLIGGGQAASVLGAATIGANGSGGLLKLGSGALFLNAANTYTGATLVTAGTLFGTGLVNSAVTVPSGAALGPYVSSSPTGTFTIASSLTLSNGSTVAGYMLGTNTGIRVTGDLNTMPTVMMVPFPIAAVSSTGAHVMIDYAANFNGAIGDFSLAAVPNGGQGYLTKNVANSSIDLVITNTGTGIKWNGLADSNWKFGSPTNWTSVLYGNATAFSAYDSVLFDDSATGVRTVNMADIFPVSSIVVSNSAADYTFNGGGISGSIGLTKNGSAQLTVSGSALTYTNTTTVLAGSLRLDSLAILNSSIANSSTVELSAASGVWVAGTNRTFTGGVFRKTGAGIVTIWNGTFSGSSLFSIEGGTLRNDGNASNWTNTNNNASLYVASGANFDMRADPVNVNTLTGSGTITNSYGNTALELLTIGVANGSGFFSGNIQDSGRVGANQDNGSITLLKVGSGTQTLAGVNNYVGSTTLDGGTLAYTADNPGLRGIVFGAVNSSTNLSIFDMTAANITCAGISNRVNNADTNVILVGVGRTLRVNGNIVLGSPAAPTLSIANQRITGAGSFIVTNANGLIQIANAPGGNNNTNRATLDLSGLNTFVADLGVGGINIGSGDNAGGSNNAPSSLLLAATNSLTMSNLNVGITSVGSTMNLVLGSVSNNINVDTLNAGTGARDRAYIGFATNTGSVVLRDRTGTNRATVNFSLIASNTTAYAGNGAVDFTGHNADLLISTLNIGAQGRNGALTNVFMFDTGVLDATAIRMANQKNSGGAQNYAYLNIGGGIVNVGNGGVIIASNAVGSLSLSGGVVTCSGSLTKGNAGTGTATLTLDGASLDLQGNVIGGTTAINNLNFFSGTLANVAEINGGAAWAKTTTGTLAIAGVNGFSGAVTVSNGTLLVNGAITGGGGITTLAGTTLGGTGVIGGSVSAVGTVAPGMSAGILTVGQNCFLTGTLDIQLGGPVAGSGYDQLIVSNSAGLGAGTLNVSLINSYMPTAGSSFTILAAGTLLDTFGTINPLPALTPATLGWNVIYTNNAVVLSVTGAPSASGYDLWAAGITNGLTNATDSATGDGYPNLLKYATGSSPTQSDTIARMNSTKTNGFFALKFNHNVGATDVTLVVEGAYTSTNNAMWNGIATNIHGSWGGTTNYSEDTGSTPAAAVVWDTDTTATNRFLRLRVTRP